VYQRINSQKGEITKLRPKYLNKNSYDHINIIVICKFYSSTNDIIHYQLFTLLIDLLRNISFTLFILFKSSEYVFLKVLNYLQVLNSQPIRLIRNWNIRRLRVLETYKYQWWIYLFPINGERYWIWRIIYWIYYLNLERFFLNFGKYFWYWMLRFQLNLATLNFNYCFLK